MNNTNILDLDHTTGFNTSVKNSLFLHPNLKEYIYIVGGIIVISEMNDPHKQRRLIGHDDYITSLSLSHTGELIASGQRGSNSDILVWDFLRGTIIYKLCEHDYEVSCLAFSKDDKLLYSSGNHLDKRIFIWDMSNGYIVAKCSLFPCPIINISWGDIILDEKGYKTDNYQFAVCGDKTIALYKLDPFKGLIDKEIFSSGGFSRDYTCLLYSIGDRYLFAGTSAGEIVCILPHIKLLVYVKCISAGGLNSIANISYNQIAVGGGDGSLSLLYIEGSKCDEIVKVNLYGGISTISVSHDGIQMIVSTNKRFIYRVRSLDLSNIMLHESHHGGINQLISLNDKNYSFGTCSIDGTIRLWSLNDYNVYSRTTAGSDILPLSLRVTDDIMISGWNDGKIRCYKNDTSELLWYIDNANKNGVSALSMSDNYNFICSGGDTGEIRVWDFRTRTIRSHLKEHIQKITKIELFSNNVHLISAAKDRVILIWDLVKEKRIANYQQNMGGVNNFQFSPLDENILFTVGQDKKITQWDLRIQNPINVINTHPIKNPELSDEIFGLAISNCGRYLAAGGSSGHIRLYDLNNNWTVLTQMYAHSSTCTGLAFTYDDKYLISTGEDSQILSFKFK